MLSHKLVVLLALTRLSRSNDLSNLSLKAMRVLPDGEQFNLVCLSKQSRPSRPLKLFTFPSFSSDKRLCPKEALQAYAARTESFRGEGKDKLLLSYVKPHSSISSVARWIVTLLKLAGIDTDTFKSHSVRSASATAAASAGITTNQIMDAADWRSGSVFETFYYRPANSNSVGQAVLPSSSTDSLQTSRWYVIRAFRNVITWMAQITERLPAILDYMRNVRWTCQLPTHPLPIYMFNLSCLRSRAS